MADAAQRQRKVAARAARRKAVVAEKKKLDLAPASLVARVPGGIEGAGRPMHDAG